MGGVWCTGAQVSLRLGLRLKVVKAEDFLISINKFVVRSSV